VACAALRRWRKGRASHVSDRGEGCDDFLGLEEGGGSAAASAGSATEDEDSPVLRAFVAAYGALLPGGDPDVLRRRRRRLRAVQRRLRRMAHPLAVLQLAAVAVSVAKLVGASARHWRGLGACRLPLALVSQGRAAQATVAAAAPTLAVLMYVTPHPHPLNSSPHSLTSLSPLPSRRWQTSALGRCWEPSERPQLC